MALILKGISPKERSCEFGFGVFQHKMTKLEGEFHLNKNSYFLCCFFVSNMSLLS